jgi:hypothetical protein
MELTDDERTALTKKIALSIIDRMQEMMKEDWLMDLSDVGNAVGMAVASHTCKDGKDMNLFSFEKSDFESGFRHGWSLHDGTH